MKRLFFLVTLSLALPLPHLATAQPAVGQTARVFPFGVTRILPDPVRSRVYATVPAKNSVAIIDTETLNVVATVFTGSVPNDLAISPDGNTLYIANSGSSTAAIGVVDLQTLKTRHSLSLPGNATSIAVGAAGRIYAAAQDGDSEYVYQLDGATGAVQTSFGKSLPTDSFREGFGAATLRMSLDGKSLFVADNVYENLYVFDVSTSVPAQVQAHSRSGFLALSHDGKHFALPGSGDFDGYHGTALRSTADLGAILGGFEGDDNNGESVTPGPLAFSVDDRLVYQLGYTGDSYGLEAALLVFDTHTFLEKEKLPILFEGAGTYNFTVTDVQVDHTGSYLFIGQKTLGDEAGRLTVLTTGEGYLTPTAILPIIATPSRLEFQPGVPCRYQVSTLNLPTSFSATGLPSGLSIDPTTGVISGTPAFTTYQPATITAVNAAGAAEMTVGIEVDSAGTNITSPLRLDVMAGESFSYQFTADQPVTEYIGYTLPAGVNFDTATGILSGMIPDFGYQWINLLVESATGGAGDGSLLIVAHNAAVGSPGGNAAADLSGAIVKSKVRIKGVSVKGGGTLAIANAGGTSAKHVALGAYLSTAPTVALPLSGDNENVRALALEVTHGAFAALRLTGDDGGLPVRLPGKFKPAGKNGSSRGFGFSFKLPTAALTSPKGVNYGYLLFVIDPQGTLKESVKTNNTTVIKLPTP